MKNAILDQLVSDEFCGRLFFVATPTALRRLLQRSPEIRSIRKNLEIGILDEETVSRFVNTLMSDFVSGSPFVHDLAISAVAVALEKRGTKFADRFLADLAQVQAAEMSMSVRVARECLRARTLVSSNAAMTIQAPFVTVAGMTNMRFGQGVPAFLAKDVSCMVHASQVPKLVTSVGHDYAGQFRATFRVGGI
jgi:hypothetical protein